MSVWDAETTPPYAAVKLPIRIAAVWISVSVTKGVNLSNK